MRPEYSEHPPFDPDRFLLDCRGRTLDARPGLEIGAHVMGILNVTPDSFSDAGRFLEPEAAIARAGEMLSEGASIIDVGGESSRPAGAVYGAGAVHVPVEEEIARVVPIVEGIAARYPEVLISVDTYKPEVARAALEAGAHLINDITGLRYTEETAAVAAEYGAPMILMHSLGKPGDPPVAGRYASVVADVRAALASAVKRAERAGVRHVVVDPGFGFGKTPEENLRLIKDVQAFLELGRPVLIGVSRKSTIGAFLGRPDAPVPVDQRLFGSLGVTAVGVLRGASIVRTHDVGETVEFVRMIGAVVNT